MTTEQQELYENSKFCYICKEKFDNKYLKDKKYHQVRWYCLHHFIGEYWDAAHSICNLNYIVPKNIIIAFHNGSNCEYYFIIKELEEELACVGESTRKYIIFTFSIKKIQNTALHKNGEEIVCMYIYIYIYIYMAS